MSHTYKKKVKLFISKLPNILIVQSHSWDVKNTQKIIVERRREFGSFSKAQNFMGTGKLLPTKMY